MRMSVRVSMRYPDTLTAQHAKQGPRQRARYIRDLRKVQAFLSLSTLIVAILACNRVCKVSKSIDVLDEACNLLLSRNDRKKISTIVRRARHHATIEPMYSLRWNIE
jgi:hypothetical protein